MTTLNLGIPEWQSGDPSNALQNDPVFQDQFSGFEIVRWYIAGNDLANAHDSCVQETYGDTDDRDCLRTAVMTFESNWDAIVVELLKLGAKARRF